MIRDATESDLAILAEGMVRLQNLHVDAFPDVYKPFSATDATLYLTDLLTRTDVYVRVLVHSNQVAGHVVLGIESTPANMFKHAQRYGHIMQIEVRPDFRQSGLGRLLISDIEEIAGRLGLNRILLDVWAFNDSAQRFFASVGYNKFGSKLIRQIETNNG